MSKVLLFSDLHCHLHKNQLSRLEDCLKVLEWVFKTAEAKGIEHIIFAGDLFQDRQKIHIISYEKTFRIIQKYCSKIKLYILVGNHDMWYSDAWEVSSVGPLSAIKNVVIIDKPLACEITEGFVVDFLPYTKNPLSDINKYFTDKNDVLVSHCSIDGAKLNASYNTKAEVSVEYEGDMVKVKTDNFSGWKRVFLGHYHCPQKLDDVVEYIGSPLELCFGEAFQEKHIIILDTKTLDTEYVVNDFSPKHLIIKEDELQNYDLAGNFVQVIVEDIVSTNIVDMKKSMKSKGCSTIEFKEKETKVKMTDSERKEMKEKLDFGKGDILERWIRAKGHGGMEFDKLFAIGQEFVNKNV